MRQGHDDVGAVGEMLRLTELRDDGFTLVTPKDTGSLTSSGRAMRVEARLDPTEPLRFGLLTPPAQDALPPPSTPLGGSTEDVPRWVYTSAVPVSVAWVPWLQGKRPTPKRIRAAVVEGLTSAGYAV